MRLAGVDITVGHADLLSAPLILNLVRLRRISSHIGDRLFHFSAELQGMRQSATYR